MKKLLSLAAVAGIAFATAAPVQADEFVARYTYLVNGVNAPVAATTTVLEQPAVIESGACGATVLTQPAVLDSCGSTVLTQPAVLGTTKPIMVEHHENLVPHIFHLGLWPLIDFSIF
jgi:hypothetical protein